MSRHHRPGRGNRLVPAALVALGVGMLIGLLTFRARAAETLGPLGTMPGAAFGLEAAPGWALGSSCNRGLNEPARGGSVVGTHGFLPSRATMATGFIAAGAGVRPGVALERIRLIDIAPTALQRPARVGHAPPPRLPEGRPPGAGRRGRCT